MPETRTGRRPGNADTRGVILDAAVKVFAEHGYERATMRSIAANAGVDPALIRHYFGDKETLFVTALTHGSSVYEQLAASLPGDPDQVGERASRTYLELWEQPETRSTLMAMTRSAATSQHAAELLRNALAGEIDAHARGRENPERLALAGAHLFGIAVARHIIQVPAISEMPLNDLIADVAPTIQRYLTGTHR